MNAGKKTKTTVKKAIKGSGIPFNYHLARAYSIDCPNNPYVYNQINGMVADSYDQAAVKMLATAKANLLRCQQLRMTQQIQPMPQMQPAYGGKKKDNKKDGGKKKDDKKEGGKKKTVKKDASKKK